MTGSGGKYSSREVSYLLLVFVVAVNQKKLEYILIYEKVQMLLSRLLGNKDEGEKRKI